MPGPQEERPAPAGAGSAPRYEQGKRFPWWGTLLLPFLLVLLPLWRALREEVDWKAALATVLLFEVVVFPAEAFSVWRGHWVYNEARIWGPRLLGVPIEEPFLYYVFPALIVIAAFHAFRAGLAKRGER